MIIWFIVATLCLNESQVNSDLMLNKSRFLYRNFCQELNHDTKMHLPDESEYTEKGKLECLREKSISKTIRRNNVKDTHQVFHLIFSAHMYELYIYKDIYLHQAWSILLTRI